MLLGTQMVAKGHHFAGVELAAVVDADTGLGMPDFRAEERTFQLITQLAGPQRPRCARAACSCRRSSPTRGRSSTRRATTSSGSSPRSSSGAGSSSYPPFSHLVRIVVTGPALEPVVRALDELKAGIARRRAARAGAAPAPARPLPRAARGEDEQPRRIASQAARLLAAAAPNMRRAGLTAVVDVDPQSL